MDDCFWIDQNINCQKISVSELIISKSSKEQEEEGEVNYYTHQLSKVNFSKKVI